MKVKPIYKILDDKGRILIPKALRTAAEMEHGDIVRLAIQKGVVMAKKVELIEIGDQSPEAMEAFVRAAVRDMPEETLISIAAKLLDIIKNERGNP